MIATNLPGAIKLIRYAARQRVKHPELFRMQLLIDVGHTTCIDLQISRDSLCAVILDSINGTNGIESLLKVMHEVGFQTTLVISHLESKTTERSPDLPGTTVLLMKTMQKDRYSCQNYAIHFALQAEKKPDFYAQCLLALIAEEDNPWVKRSKQQWLNFPWLNYITWSKLNPSFMKYSQSETFARAHGFFGNLKSPGLIQKKILELTAQQLQKPDTIQEGPVTQVRKFGL